MKKKQVLIASSALMIATTTLIGFPTLVMAQESLSILERKDVFEDKIIEESKNKEAKSGSITIDEVYFPDTVFRDYLLEKSDLDNNNELSEAERNKLKVIFIDGNVDDLKSLKGIEYFPNLIEIYCPKTNISELDITKNTKLKKVTLSEAPIKKLDVSKNVELEELNIYRTLITDIDVSNNPKLKYLDCQYTNISNLDVSKNLELNDLACAHTEIENLNIQNNIKLQDLYIHNTKIQKIDTSNNPLLKELVCYETSITSLDISNNPKLKIFDCQNTRISNLDVSKNLKLESLNFSHTEITNLDISNNSELKKLAFYGNDIAEIDISHNLGLEEIWCQDSNIQMLDVSQHINLKELHAYNVGFLGLCFGNNLNLHSEFSSPTRKSIIIEGNTFNFLEKTNKNIDLSKVTITSNGILDKNTGIITVEDTTKVVTYEYDCGISQKGKETLEVVLELNSQTENTAPTIFANDVTLNIGDTFDPLINVTATDKEDGTIILKKDNIIANDVDTSKAGIYHVTYKVTDKNGAFNEKTIIITVKEKNTNKPVSPQQPQQPNKPTTSKPSGQKNSVKTGDMTNVGVFTSMFASSTVALAILFDKKHKRTKNDQ